MSATMSVNHTLGDFATDRKAGGGGQAAHPLQYAHILNILGQRLGAGGARGQQGNSQAAKPGAAAGTQRTSHQSNANHRGETLASSAVKMFVLLGVIFGLPSTMLLAASAVGAYSTVMGAGIVFGTTGGWLGLGMLLKRFF
jgi:hypothetical protein